MSSRATNKPQRIICGVTRAGMNCTAWNSVLAKALTNRPSDMPSSALPTASAITRRRRAGNLHVEQAERDSRGDECLHGGHERECQSVAHQQVELGERQGHEALQRSRGSLAQHRDRRDHEHRDEREHADQRPTHVLEAGWVLLQRDT